MSTIKMDDISIIERSIQAELRYEVNRRVDAHVEQIRRELSAKVATIAMSLMKQYDITRDQGSIVIRVIHTEKPGE